MCCRRSREGLFPPPLSVLVRLLFFNLVSSLGGSVGCAHGGEHDDDDDDKDLVGGITLSSNTSIILGPSKLSGPMVEKLAEPEAEEVSGLTSSMSSVMMP